MLDSLIDLCLSCLSLNGSGWLIALAIVILALNQVHSSHANSDTGNSHAILPPSDFGRVEFPTAAPHTVIVQLLSIYVTPRNYIKLFSFFTRKIVIITKINDRSFLNNTFRFFLFYYMIVSAPAAVMVPINYNSSYNYQSLIALLLMMLTNAIGDVISFKITMKNAKRLIKYECSNNDNSKEKDFFYGVKIEMFMYFITICDLIVALFICFFVLVLTSVYFGVSIGEYEFEFTQHALNGSLTRIINFWDTVNEPYWIKKQWGQVDGPGLPMLLIYSISSFFPTILLLLCSIIWTLLFPVRIIFMTKMDKFKKLFFSEVSVLILCIIINLAVETSLRYI